MPSNTHEITNPKQKFLSVAALAAVFGLTVNPSPMHKAPDSDATRFIGLREGFSDTKHRKRKVHNRIARESRRQNR